MKLVRLALILAATTGLLTATFASAGAGCCAKKAKATKVAGADKATCAKDGQQVAAKKSCAGTTATVATTEACALKPGRIALRGVIMCNHCDLHVSETCQTLLKTAAGCTYALAAGDHAATLAKNAGHGTKEVKVRGEANEAGVVTVSSFRILGDAANVGM